MKKQNRIHVVSFRPRKFIKPVPPPPVERKYIEAEYVSKYYIV